jgi:hypothetical protein
LAVEKNGRVVQRAWIEEEATEDFNALFRQSGCDVIDVQLARRTLDLTDPYARLSHILRNPQAIFAEPTRK